MTQLPFTTTDREIQILRAGAEYVIGRLQDPIIDRALLVLTLQ
jgi:hypothetical protein